MTMNCSCVSDEEKKLLLEAVASLIDQNKGIIDIVPIPDLEEKVKNLYSLEKEIKDLTSCKDLWSLIREEGKWWFSSAHGKTGPYNSESEAESYAKDFGIKYIKE